MLPTHALPWLCVASLGLSIASCAMDHADASRLSLAASVMYAVSFWINDRLDRMPNEYQLIAINPTPDARYDLPGSVAKVSGDLGLACYRATQTTG